MGILDELYTTKYIVFLDIEFQTINQQPYILELGIIIFEHNKDQPVLIDHVNFPLLEKDNLRLLLSKYCTTTEETELKMKNLENEFHIDVTDIESIRKKQDLIQFIPDKNVRKLFREGIKTNSIEVKYPEKTQKIVDQMFYNLYKNRLNNTYKTMYNEIFQLYKNDELVKKRLINPYNYLSTLKPYFNQMTLIHKEGMDIIALNNDLKKYNVKIENRIFHKDIAKYNDIFRKKYITAKLYESYIYLKKDYYEKHLDLIEFNNNLLTTLNKKMNVIKAHNPLSDAYFTIIIFIIMEKYFK